MKQACLRLCRNFWQNPHTMYLHSEVTNWKGYSKSETKLRIFDDCSNALYLFQLWLESEKSTRYGTWMHWNLTQTEKQHGVVRCVCAPISLQCMRSMQSHKIFLPWIIRPLACSLRVTARQFRLNKLWSFDNLSLTHIQKHLGQRPTDRNRLQQSELWKFPQTIAISRTTSADRNL